MNFKNPFALSPALILENLKMYWYVPALSFVIYFMSGIFPILINREQNESLAYFIHNSLRNYSFPFCLLMIFVPLVAAVMMMVFMHKPARAMAIHSQPFSRSKIFNSHVLTGWCMCVLPIIFMTIFYLLFRRDLYIHSEFYFENGGAEYYETTSVYTVGNVLLWFFSSLAIVTFFYGMYVLAGSLVGSSTMHVLLCGVFFVILPLILWLSVMYCENFLYGFSEMPEYINQLMSDANPILYLMFHAAGTTISMNLGYLFSALIMFLLARFAYGRAPLERVGDSMIYRLIEEIITYLVVFVGMTIFGFFFYSIAQYKWVMLIGMGTGALITFIIVKIIFNKSIRIINKKNIRSFVIYLVIAVLFAAGTVYDATGYAKRIPKASEIQAVDCSEFMMAYSLYAYYNLPSDKAAAGERNYNKDLTSEESILKVLTLHQYIVENGLYELEDSAGALVYDSDGSAAMRDNEYLRFAYKLKNGKRLSRYFDIALDDTAAALIDDILHCKEYLDNTSLANNIDFEEVSHLQIYLYYSYFDDEELQSEGQDDIEAEQSAEAGGGEEAFLTLKDPQKIKELLAALEQDHYNRRYMAEEDSLLRNGLTINGEIYLEDSSKSSNNDDSLGQSNMRMSGDEINVAFYLTPQDKTTLSVLRDLCHEEGYTFFEQKLDSSIRD